MSTPSPTFPIGQRVRTTVDAPAAWPGAFAAPAGTLGTITDSHDQWGSYGVLLDGDPDNLPASFHADELSPTCSQCGTTPQPDDVPPVPEWKCSQGCPHPPSAPPTI